MTFDNQPGAQPPQPGPQAHDNSYYQSGQYSPFSQNNPGYPPGPNPPSMPGGNPGYPPMANPPSMPGQMGNSNPGYPPMPNPPSMPGQMPGGNPGYQYRPNPPSMPGQMGNSNPGYPPMANPPSMPGQMGNPNAGYQQGPAPAPFFPPEAPDDKKEGMSRRSILKVSAIAGGTLAVVGGGVVAAQRLMTRPNSSPAQQNTTQSPSGGQVREYWVQADAFHHNLVPNGKDGMMGMVFKPEQSSYWAIGYRAYTPNWGKPLPASDDIGANTGIPGPVFRGSVGDTIHVHFRNNDTHYKLPHSMHPHGVLYTPANDGAWIISDPQPGAMVAPGQSYTYEWHVRPNSVGTWIYHDHSVSRTVGDSMLMEFGAEVGLFGFLVLTDASTKPATKEFFTFLHDLYQSDVTGLSQDYDCFNGFSYLGNTPTFSARVGDTIRWHIGALGKEFHAFHLHGHRWSSNGQFVDVVQLGPSNGMSFDFVADNPGKWLYHCHVTDHMMGGMIGMYEISA